MTIRALAAVLLCSFAITPLRAEAPAAAPGDNIQLTITVTAERDGKVEQSKTFALVCRDGESTQLSVGNRVPIPATTVNPDAGKDAAPVTSYTYQNVGFLADLRCGRLKDGRITVKGGCDDSSLRGTAPGAPGQPIVTTFRQEIDVLLAPGKPLTVARFSDMKGQTTSLTIEAKPLD